MELTDCPQNQQQKYQRNFAAKAAKFEAQWQALGLTTGLPGTEQLPQRFASPPQHYRARMEFALHRIGGPNANTDSTDSAAQLRYAMFERNAQGEKKVQRFRRSEVPLRCISERMPPLLDYLQGEERLTRSLFQANWRADLDGQVMLSLLYRRALSGQKAGDGGAWCAAAQRLAEALELHCVLGRSKSRLLHVGPPYLESRLDLGPENPDNSGAAQVLYLRQSDTCFSQPNPYINLAMLRWAQQHFQAPDSDLLELYCGIGNFTCALTPNFRRVLATEVVRQSIAFCRHNLQANGLDNVAIGRLSAAETAQALAGERQFERLATLDLSSYRLTHLLLDPPRSGLDEQCRRLAIGFDNILYISCNPDQLLQDLAFWQQEGGRYRIQAVAAFDQFPYADHLEVGVVLHRPS